ncbi:type I restriction endonuclease [Bacillus tianshenii]|nr:type I restriction endonuclease [Bacillus tianshenii]
MNLKETLAALAKVIDDNHELIKNEESTKQFLVLPLLRGLGYDTFSPQEVTPEFTADFHKKKEKVDYAISMDSVPKIFIEVKAKDRSINKSTPQLSRYFSTFPSVRLGILTNGIEYRFFTDLNNANIMDAKPFFIFNLLDYKEEDFNNLIQFSKNIYDYERIKSLAESLMYYQSFKSVIKEILEDPSDDFVKFVIKERFRFKVTQQFINTAKPLVKKGIQESLSEMISEKLGTNLKQTSIGHESVAEETDGELQKKDKKKTYSAEEINSLGRSEEFENIRVVLPNANAYDNLLKATKAEYSVEKGNPFSKFFVSSVLTQGSSIVGYLIGQYVDEKNEDVTLYAVKSNGIEKFLEENPVVKEAGFINAKLGSRTKKDTQETTYYLKSSITNLSFRDVPNLVSQIENIDEFFMCLQ